jgi:AcrR family transcriptional regulator
MAGQRLDVQALARELGVGRTTLYGWFGSRERLIGEAFARAARVTVAAIRDRVEEVGARAVLETLRRYDRVVARHPGIGAQLHADPVATIRIVTDPAGASHRAHLEIFERLITDEVIAGAYTPPIAASTLAYALVLLGEHAIFIEAQRFQPDLERLAVVQAHLLGIEP